MCFFFQAEDGIRDLTVTGVQTCALPISIKSRRAILERQQAKSETKPRISDPKPCAAVLRTLGAHPVAVPRDPSLDRKSTTSELQSQSNLVCRLLLEKKKKQHLPTSCVTS